jgi:hypothetical protein
MPASTIDIEEVRAIEHHFHALIRQRASEFDIAELPDLPVIDPDQLREYTDWFAVPGMYGGFAYGIDTSQEVLTLVSSSWCRVLGGSGQRHLITKAGAVLVEAGFM